MSGEDSTDRFHRNAAIAAHPVSPQLARIAEILRRPVEDFFNGEAESEPSQTAELIRLWAALHDPDLRRGVLVCLREAVARQEIG